MRLSRLARAAAAHHSSLSSQQSVASAPLLFPGGEPDGPSVRTAIPGPKSQALQRELATMQVWRVAALPLRRQG